MAKRILVVDDEAPLLRMLIAALGERGYEAVGASDGVEGLKQLAENGEFDLVICDYAMPEMNGIQLLKESKRLFPRLPVVVMTAYADKSHLSTCLDSGAEDYLPKPFRADELDDVVNRSIQKGERLRFLFGGR
jgi:CheY-like chemotaxis protein